MNARTMRRATTLVATVILALLVALGPSAVAEGPDTSTDVGPVEVEYPEVVEVIADDRETLSELGSMGFDLAEEVHEVADGVEVQAVVTGEQRAQLDALPGVRVGRTVVTQADAEALQAEYQAMTEALEATLAAVESTGDELRVQRAQWFQDEQQGRFLEVEVWSSAGTAASTTLTVAFNAGPGTQIGDPGSQSFNLSRFIDAGQYMFHRANSPVLITTANPPTRMRVTSSEGGSVEVDVRESLTGVTAKGPGAPIDQSDTYQTSFVDKYLDATETYERLEALAAEFPHLAEIIELPNETNGYRRKAQALLDPAGNRLSITAPAATVGDYPYAAASYGPAVPGAGTLSATFSLVSAPVSPGFDGAPADEGCGPLVGFPAGDVALVRRGTCPFVDKTRYAQEAGASAVVLVNNVGGAPIAPGGTATGLTIPTVMISQADGDLLIGNLPVTGRIFPGAAVTNAARVGVDSVAWGHEGGNGITIQALDPGAVSSPLAVAVSGNHITVSLATNAAGARTSTAAQVRNAINAHPAASALVFAYTYRGNAGNGVVAPTPVQRLSDFLGAPDSVSREPFTVKAIRIGRHRDGSRIGVFGYSQEHAREWVTPLVALESAERLLRNYGNDDNTKRIVDDLDIFIVPSINPDGTHYSIHDFTLQRRTMTRHCAPTGNFDLLARNTWGVDLNRNFTVGSIWQGFAGASSSCTSDTYAGPGPLSEPEAKNEVWLTEQFPNIRFSMNIHSHGGYFMWAPGAYRQATRDGLERPSYGTERYFYEASEHILDRIKEHRGTNVWDSRVGPISDVLYSAAGNSGDEHYYNRGIFAWTFEVGAPRRNAANTGWVSVGFTPPFAEGYEEAMEFSNGLIGMFEVARMYARDTVPPRSTLSPGAGTYTGPTRFTFDLSEPADVYYTIDGSRPTYDSPRIEYEGPRQQQAGITIDKSTTVRWFSVDVRGNVEANYNPDGRGNNFHQAKVTIR
jgi:hypothetical protein